MQVLSMQYARNKKSHPDLILGKNTFLIYLPYLVSEELSAHILTQGRAWDELVPFRGFFYSLYLNIT